MLSYFRKILFLHNTKEKHSLITQLLLSINMAVVPPVAFRHRSSFLLPPKQYKQA